MKVSPIPNMMTPVPTNPGVPQQSNVESLRALKMKTNATPLMQEIPMQGQIQEPESPPAPAAATQALSPQLALLAKQRRALQRERELLNQEKARLSQNSGTSAIDLAQLKSEPLRVLLENGVTYEQLTEEILNNQKNSEVFALKEEIKNLREGIDKKFTEKTQQEEQAALHYMRQEAERFVRGSDQFELIRETRSIPTVMQLIERTYRQTGEVLDVPEALKLVEDELLNDALKIQRLKKLQSRLSPPAPQMQPTERRYTGMRTLTNRDTANVPMSAKARAMAAFYGTLKR